MKLLIFFAVVLLAGVHLIQCTVTYDKKSLIINGQRRILLSGSIHYPRSTPDMWEDLIQKAKDGGLDVIDTYVFWNVHEPSPGNYNFGERYDLVRFIKTVQKAGLYVHLRIGPYICGEWNFGGFPVWLKYVPGISFRTDNDAFKAAMKGFSEKIVGLMKNENLFETQGGPIILSQIENEYGGQSKALGGAGKDYMNWAAKMAVQLDTGVPWVMCKQDDAPDPIINTCNGFYCDTFVPNKPYKPTMWTEAWTGWFTEFGGAFYERPVQDLAFAVARFILKGGSFVNYYMYHGGTNFGRTSGGQFVTTTYDYDAPIDEYGLIKDPKYSHLKELHKAIKLCEPALVSADSNLTSLGPSQQAFVFSTSNNGQATCAAFLCNSDSKSDASVVFNGNHYHLPPWSISILPDCKNAVFNTAKIGSQTSRIRMIPTGSTVLSWERYDEDLSSIDENPTVNAVGLLEQLNVTKDASDYLWYMTSVEISSSESFLLGGNKPTLVVTARAQAVHVFINGLLSGSAYGTNKAMRFQQTVPVNLHAGTNSIALLSITMGLPNIGAHFETWIGGVIGPVLLQGLDRGRLDLTWKTWTYKVGLKGETMNLDTPEGVSSVDWIHVSAAVTNKKPLTWYKAYFNAPQGNEPLALDMKSMGKGQVWINGQSIGRYWTVKAIGNCGTRCSYAGTYRESKCQLGCGKPTQRWYHVPRAWLKTTQNLLVVFEELGGDISKINLVKRSTTSLCADAYENQQTIQNSRQSEISHNPKIQLQCTSDQSIISSIKFASYGNPSGTCGTFQKGTCHALNSQTVIEKMCIGRKSCNMTVSNGYFQKDPCPNMLKRLTVEAVCSRT